MSTKEQAHTAGPWIAAAGPSSIVGWPIVAQTGRLICNLATPPKNIDRIGKAKDEYDAFMAECGANARLIAAAPDLLAALEDAMRSSRKDFKIGPDGDRQHRDAYAAQFAAISRATSAAT